MKAINVNKGKPTHYCGRASSYRKEYGEDTSILGNPFPMANEAERESCIQKFRVYLNQERLKQSAVWQAVLALPENAVLGCFCKPKACHCDIIIQAYEWAKQVETK